MSVWPTQASEGVNQASDEGKGRSKNMKTFKFIGLALVAMFALSAFVASAANAEETLTFLLANILINGAAAGEVEASQEGEILLEDEKGGGGVQCHGFFDGLILGPAEPSHFLIEEVLNLNKELLLPLLCTATKSCEASTTDVEVTPENLPWLIEFELMEPGGTLWGLVFADTAGTKIAYTVSCLILGLKITDKCTAAEGTEGQVKNLAGGVEAVEEISQPKGECSVGGANSAVVEPKAGNLITSPAGIVSISSE